MSEPTQPNGPLNPQPVSSDFPTPPTSTPNYEFPQETPAQSAFEPAGVNPAVPQYGAPAQAQAPLSGLAIASLVCAILAILGSFVPILNVVSILLALVAVGLGIAAIVSSSKGGKRGKGLGIAGVIVGAVAIIVSILINALVYKAANDIYNDPEFQQLMEDAEQQDALDDLDTTADDADDQDDAAAQNLAIGETAIADDGLKVTVKAIEKMPDDYSGEILKVTVAYENTGTERANFSSYEWGSINAGGVFNQSTFAAQEISNELADGALIPGASTEGVVVLQGDAATITYDADYDGTPEATWVVQ